MNKRLYTKFVSLAPGDQRMALDTEGNVYIFDNSGSSPDRTDDGPLLLNLAKSFSVHATGVDVSVIAERNDGEYRVMMTHAAGLKLNAELRAIGKAPLLRADISSELQELLGYCWNKPPVPFENKI